MSVVMTKSPGISPLPSGKLAAHVQNLTWESAHEPPFPFPDVPAQAGAASPGVLCSGKIADWK